VALRRCCRASMLAGVGGARDEDLVGAVGRPGHDLGDRGGVVWGCSLGCRPMWAMVAVKFGGRPCGELRPALRGVTTFGRMAARSTAFGPCRQRGKNFSFRGCIRRPMGHPFGPTTCTAVCGAPPLRKKVVSSQRTTKAKARRSHSLPLLTYSAPGGLRQDPGRAAESAAGPRTDEDRGSRRACVVVDGRGTR
jgi:hypothetical protein